MTAAYHADPLGYIVVIRDDGRPGWHADWDGEVHPTPEAGKMALREAQAVGYHAVLTALIPGVPYQPDGEEVPR